MGPVISDFQKQLTWNFQWSLDISQQKLWNFKVPNFLFHTVKTRVQEPKI